MNRPPAFQFYPDKFLAGTAHLSRSAKAIYIDILCWMWQHSDDFCSIVNSEVVIKLTSHLTNRDYKKYFLGEIMNKALPLFKVEDNRLVSNGLRKEAQKQKEKREKASKNANARWSQCVGNADASIPQCSLSLTTSLKEDVVNNTQGRSAKEHSPNAHNTTAPAPQEAELNMLVKQFTSKCVWTGGPAPVYKHLRALLQHYRADEISAQIAKAKPGTKPWDIADALNKAARTCEGDVKPYRPEIPPGAGPIDKDTIAKCFEATRNQIKTEASA